MKVLYINLTTSDLCVCVLFILKLQFFSAVFFVGTKNVTLPFFPPHGVLFCQVTAYRRATPHRSTAVSTICRCSLRRREALSKAEPHRRTAVKTISLGDGDWGSQKRLGKVPPKKKGSRQCESCGEFLFCSGGPPKKVWDFDFEHPHFETKNTQQKEQNQRSP